MADRDTWRETDLRIRLAGGKKTSEPDWGLDDFDPSVSAQQESDFEAMKAEYKEANSDPEGRKFPGTL